MTPYLSIRQLITSELHTRRSNNDNSNLRLFFRGQACDTWKIEPNICRPSVADGRSERDLINEQMAQGNWDTNSSLFENIAYMQHYGVPTRFLDFTTDIDIALFFACEDKSKMDCDGEIIACLYDYRNEEFIDTLLVTELVLLDKPVYLSTFIEGIIRKYPILSYSNGFLSPEKELALSLLSWIDHGFMVTPSDKLIARIEKKNPRLILQHGAFFIPGNMTDSICPKACTTEISTTTILPSIAQMPSTICDNRIIHRFKVPKEEKDSILHDLAEAGISKTTIMPDAE